MICDECKRHLGAHASRHPHSNLASPGNSVPAQFQAQRYQTLYVCRVCKSILSRGRNTGWTQVDAMPAPPSAGAAVSM